MVKTTLYLPDDLKAAIERLAAEEQRSEAEIVREAIRDRVRTRAERRPTIPLPGRALGDARAAERVDDLLAGFGRE